MENKRVLEKLKNRPTTCWDDITDKINEIVDWLNNKEAAEELDDLDLPMEVFYCPKYPDFVKWNREAIETSVWQSFSIKDYCDVFLTLAPEDFYMVENGKKKYLFTWDEAMKLEEEVLKPNGWRLPTCKELCQLCATYVDENGNDDTERFMKELKVEMRGYKDTNGNIVGVGHGGYWWSSTAASSTNARYLGFYSGAFYPQNNNNKGCGFIIRPVRVSEQWTLKD